MKKTETDILTEMVRQRRTIAQISRELAVHRNTVSSAIHYGLNKPTRDRIIRLLWPSRETTKAA